MSSVGGTLARIPAAGFTVHGDAGSACGSIAAAHRRKTFAKRVLNPAILAGGGVRAWRIEYFHGYCIAAAALLEKLRPPERQARCSQRPPESFSRLRELQHIGRMQHINVARLDFIFPG